jgi:hypothetical protein
MGGALGVSEASREGGLILVTLVAEPVAVPGEAKGGVALGAGLPVPVAMNVPVAVPSAAPLVVEPVASSSPTSGAAVATKGEVLAAAPAPVAEVLCRHPSFSVRSRSIPNAHVGPVSKASSACVSRSLQTVPCGKSS